MSELRPVPLSSAAVRAVDQRAIETLGLPGSCLMETAGACAAGHIAGFLAEGRGGRAEHGRGVVLCGPGNNGGDGYVIARYLAARGFSVETWSTRPWEADRTGEAQMHRGVARGLGIADRVIADTESAAQLAAAPWIVDALLGTGQRLDAARALREPFAALVAAANAARGPRIAIDVPTGLDCDTGDVGDTVFAADLTVTFVAPKVGFATRVAQSMLGRVVVCDLGLPPEFVEAVRRDVDAPQACPEE